MKSHLLRGNVELFFQKRILLFAETQLYQRKCFGIRAKNLSLLEPIARFKVTTLMRFKSKMHSSQIPRKGNKHLLLI